MMFNFHSKRSHAVTNGDSLRIRVADGAFHPNEIHAVAGRPVRITFHREDPAACAERVVFPALGREQELPLEREVTLELTPEAPGASEFTCGMGMLHGQLIVTASLETASCGHAGHEPSRGHGGHHAHGGGGCCGGHS